jgi:hypothetical protein
LLVAETVEQKAGHDAGESAGGEKNVSARGAFLSEQAIDAESND